MEKQQQQLEVYKYKEEIINLVCENSISIITGETGCGKSTQIGQFLLDSDKVKQSLNLKTDEKMKIVITQPRRIAAISMAKRVSEERKVKLGEEVGYQIRFENKIDKEKTQISYMTDAILLQEIVKNKELVKKNYKIIIIDEAHERTITSEIILSLLKEEQKRGKKELRVVVMSACLEVKILISYLSPCGVLEMKGREFEVEIMYASSGIELKRQVEEAVNAVIRMHLHEPAGDILVFLNGQAQCEQAVSLTYHKLSLLLEQSREVPPMLLFSLYSLMTNSQQQNVFTPTPIHTRKVIFSTNISETSLTIPNIVYVIDNGTFKQLDYNVNTGMEKLMVHQISKNQAKQRAGRAGRTCHGKCYRLYTYDHFKSLQEFSIPEILRVNLSSSLLQLKCLNIEDVINFDYIQKPDRENIIASLKQLYLLNAIGSDNNITNLGIQMSNFPIEPKFAKILILSLFIGVRDDIITLLALISTENIWQKINTNHQNILQAQIIKQKEFSLKYGDHDTLLRIYKKWKKTNYSQSFAKNSYFNLRALNQAKNIVDQLQSIANNLDMEKCKQFIQQDHIYQIYQKSLQQQIKITDSELLRMTITSGLFYNSAKNIYNTSNYILINDGKVVTVDKNSVFVYYNEYPEYVIFTELFSNDGVNAQIKLVSKIKQEWIQPYLDDIKSLQNQDFMLKIQNLKRKVDPEKEKEIQILERLAQQQEKLQEAKERFLQRKKLDNI